MTNDDERSENQWVVSPKQPFPSDEVKTISDGVFPPIANMTKCGCHIQNKVNLSKMELKCKANLFSDFLITFCLFK